MKQVRIGRGASLVGAWRWRNASALRVKWCKDVCSSYSILCSSRGLNYLTML